MITPWAPKHENEKQQKRTISPCTTISICGTAVVNCFTTLIDLCLVLHDTRRGIWKWGAIIYSIIFGKNLQGCGLGSLLLSIHVGELKEYKLPASEMQWKMSGVLKKAWERSSYTECCGSIGKVSSFGQSYFNMQTRILWNKDNMGHTWCETVSQRAGHCRRPHRSSR